MTLATPKTITQGSAPNQRSLAFDYDGDGNLQQVTDAEAHVTSFAYDGLDRLTKQIFPDAQEVRFQYDDKKRSDRRWRLTTPTPG